jgi:hypothetical protein
MAAGGLAVVIVVLAASFLIHTVIAAAIPLAVVVALGAIFYLAFLKRR